IFSKRLEKIPQVPLLFPFIIILTNYSKMEVAVESQASFFKTSQDIATCAGVENCYSSFSRRLLEVCVILLKCITNSEWLP
ncbi:LOW QUALITY PROTEIN: TCF4 isoform 84, partial [Pongo abelii]